MVWYIWFSIELLVDGRADQSPFVPLTAIEVENRQAQETHKRDAA